MTGWRKEIDGWKERIMERFTGYGPDSYMTGEAAGMDRQWEARCGG